MHKKRRLFAESLDAIGKVSFAFFIPVYFAIVGLKLDLIRGVSLWMMLAFIGGTCIVKVLSVSLAARLAGFRGLDLVNLAITTNAREGPGIVLASVAFDASIISSKFYTTLVVAAVLTSQIAGAWLDYVLHKGWPLLIPSASGESAEARQRFRPFLRAPQSCISSGRVQFAEALISGTYSYRSVGHSRTQTSKSQKAIPCPNCDYGY